MMGELENIISRKRSQFIESEMIDNACINDDLSELYKLINQEAAGLKDGGRYDYKNNSQPFGERVKKRARKGISKAHRKYKGRQWYDRLAAPVLKTVTRKWLQPVTTLDYSSLLEMDDERFVIELYRKILGREPDGPGLSNNVKLLDDQKITRMEMIDAFCGNSERTRPVRIKGKLKARFARGEK